MGERGCPLWWEEGGRPSHANVLCGIIAVNFNGEEGVAEWRASGCVVVSAVGVRRGAKSCVVGGEVSGLKVRELEFNVLKVVSESEGRKARISIMSVLEG